MEGEWSCYRGGHFNRGKMVMLQKVITLTKGEWSHVQEVVSLKKGDWSC